MYRTGKGIGRNISLRCCAADKTDLTSRIYACGDGEDSSAELLASFTGVSMLLRNKHVALVGDSLMDHLFVEWARQLGARRVPAEDVRRLYALPGAVAPTEPAAREWCVSDRLRVPHHVVYDAARNLTLSFFTMHVRATAECAAAADPLSRWVVGAHEAKDMDISMLFNALRVADVAVVNLGVQWNAELRHHYLRSLRAVMSALQRANSNGNGVVVRRRRQWAVYRMSTPQHFAPSAASTDRSGYFHGPTPASAPLRRPSRRCAPLDRANMSQQWRTQLEWRVAAEMGLPSRFLVPSWPALADRWDAHPPRNPGDCTHYCYHPAIFAAVVAPVVRTLRRVLEGDGWTRARR